MAAAAAERDEQLKRKEEEHAAQLKNQEEEWVAKLASMADSLNRTVIEKDALRDLQKSEIERQIQMRQNAWSDHMNQMRQELDNQRAAGEAERTAMMQEHHKKLMEVSEDCKTQVIQARRQAADAELAAVEASAKLTHDLKEACDARDAAESQLQQQAETLCPQAVTSQGGRRPRAGEGRAPGETSRGPAAVGVWQDTAPARRGLRTPVETARAGIVPRL